MTPLALLPRVTDSYRLLRSRPGALARAAWPGALAALATPFLLTFESSYVDLLAVVLNPLALAITAVAWQRLAGLGEDPGRPLHFRLGTREILYALIGQLMEGFSAVPVILLGMLLTHSDFVLPLPRSLAAFVLYQLFLVLVGHLFLLLAHVALARKGEGFVRLAARVNTGGLAIGFGLVVAGLPFAALATVFGLILPDGGTIGLVLLRHIAMFVPTLLYMAVTGGFLAMAWVDLKPPETAAAST